MSTEIHITPETSSLLALVKAITEKRLPISGKFGTDYWILFAEQVKRTGEIPYLGEKLCHIAVLTKPEAIHAARVALELAAQVKISESKPESERDALPLADYMAASFILYAKEGKTVHNLEQFLSLFVTADNLTSLHSGRHQQAMLNAGMFRLVLKEVGSHCPAKAAEIMPLICTCIEEILKSTHYATFTYAHGFKAAEFLLDTIKNTLGGADAQNFYRRAAEICKSNIPQPVHPSDDLEPALETFRAKVEAALAATAG